MKAINVTYISDAHNRWFKENNLSHQELINIGNAKILLNVIIESLIKDFERYNQRKDKNDHYIKKQKRLINDLLNVYHISNYFSYFPYLIIAHEKIMNILNKDPNIGIIQGNFIINKNNSNRAFFDIIINHG